MNKLLCSIKYMPLKYARPLERGLRFMESSSLLFRAWKPIVRMFLKNDFAVDSESMKSVPGTVTAYLKWMLICRNRPLVSVLIPTYNTDARVLKKCIESVLGQVYQKWELCIVDDASTRTQVRRTLLEYARKDPRIHVRFSNENRGIARTINRASQMATGQYVGVLDHDDELAPTALVEYIGMINEHPDADCIYCDEDKINEAGVYCDPWFKSDWNPDLALSFNYIMHFVLYRRTFFQNLGGFLDTYDGSQDYDLVLRASERTDEIYHIPKILYHWRMGSGSIASGPAAKPDVFVSGLAAVNDALKRRGIDGAAEDAPDAWQGVYRVKRRIRRPFTCSVIVLSTGNRDGLERLLKNIFSHFPPERSDVIICENPFSGPDQTETRAPYPGNVTGVACNGGGVPQAFNTGARRARGDFLFFLDDTFELVSGESYHSLIEQIQRQEVGAVGGKVYYENGLVEHGGTILGPFNLLGYAHRATPDDAGYVGLKNMISNFSAVMGLGMMTPRRLFMEMGGFDNRYETAYWDADYCLKLRDRGYLITYTPYATLKHHIPVRSVDEMIVEPDATRFRKRWQRVIDRDPYFNENFSRHLESFSYDGVMYPSDACVGASHKEGT